MSADGIRARRGSSSGSLLQGYATLAIPERGGRRVLGAMAPPRSAWIKTRKATTSVALVPPELLETVRPQLCVAHGVLDIFVPEVGLQGPRIVAGICQSEAACMSQHVGVGF